MRGEFQRVARPAQMRPQNSEVTEPKFTRFLSDIEGSSAVLKRILPSVVECQRIE